MPHKTERFRAPVLPPAADGTLPNDIPTASFAIVRDRAHHQQCLRGSCQAQTQKEIETGTKLPDHQTFEPRRVPKVGFDLTEEVSNNGINRFAPGRDVGLGDPPADTETEAGWQARSRNLK
ncbi:hypothetical protein FZEAL_9275 [Fusarium zealandicum]|uniref:Uncharacterized protein n=1 Tax=Fusarium zealandicum TaxID=1053134 RepID=A0A8H4UBY2_9HYPO|nr:hypothetical protein FZEAL_9275 [Fusarium zealandicum]